MPTLALLWTPLSSTRRDLEPGDVAVIRTALKLDLRSHLPFLEPGQLEAKEKQKFTRRINMNLKRRTHNVRQHWSWHPPLDFRPTQGTFRSRPEAWRTSLHKPQEATVDPMHPEPLPLPGGSLLTTSTAAAWNWNPDHPPPDFSPAAWRPPSWLSPVYWQDGSASNDATSQSRPPQAPTAAKATAPEFASVSVSASNTYDYPFSLSSSFTDSTSFTIGSSLTETTLLSSPFSMSTGTTADATVSSASPSAVLPTMTSSPTDLAKTVSSPTSALSAATLYIVLGIFLLFGILCVLVTSPGLFEMMRRKRNIRRARAAAAAGGGVNSGSGSGAGSAAQESNP